MIYRKETETEPEHGTISYSHLKLLYLMTEYCLILFLLKICFRSIHISYFVCGLNLYFACIHFKGMKTFFLPS